MKSTSRRQFLATAMAGATTIAAPWIRTTRRSGNSPVIFGQAEHRYEFLHDWAQLPDRYSWQTTHNVAVDRSGLVYVIHEGRADQPDHPSIFVFDPDGKFVRAFGELFQGGGHGLEVREEGGEEFLYVAAYQQVKTIAKLTLTGEVIWQRFAPMDSGVYADGEDTNRRKIWGRDRFMPTNFAFLPLDGPHQGDFFVADGYGSYCIHRYDRDGNWKAHFAGPGQGQGKFNTPHGLWVDPRAGELRLAVTDRAHHTLQLLDLDGAHLQTFDGFGLPANIDVRGELMLVPELLGRITLLNSEFDPVAVLGDDRKRIEADKTFAIRRDESRWVDGKFIHPHDACFDSLGNIYVAEWVARGRLSKLKKLS